MSGPHSLRRRITSAFAMLALCTALLFSVFAVIFMYALEDEFFANMLAQESAHQRESWRTAGTLAPPLRPYVTLHRSAATLPPDLAGQSGAAGGEYFGDAGRHYHVRRLALPGAPPVLLVAEVSSELLVRPRLPMVIGLLGGLLAAILIVTTGLGYWLAGRATRPLDTLAALVGRAQPGQLPKGFAKDYPDNEIGALARALDAALARVADFIEREQHFTRDASHELRTPLAVIDGAAYLLADQPMSPLAAQQLSRIRSAATQMAQVVDTLLALAREDLAAGAAANGALPPTSVPLLPIAESAIVQMAHLLEGKEVQVDLDIDAGAQVPGNRTAVAILLGNLVSNAFQHTQSGTVRISYLDGRVAVSDQGPGIDPGIADRLFEAGVKGTGSGGHGIGLSIAARLASRLGISLHLAGAPGGGTVATLDFTACGQK